MGATYNVSFMLSLSRHGHYHVRRKGNTWRKRYCNSSGPTALRLLTSRCGGARRDKLYLRIVHSEGLPCVEVHEAVEGVSRL